MPVGCPFNELKLTDQLRTDPATILHLSRSEARTPAPRLLLGEICERTICDLQKLETLQKFRSFDRSLGVKPFRVRDALDELHQRVERGATVRIAGR